MKRYYFAGLACLLLLVGFSVSVHASALVPVTFSTVLSANDDGSTSAVNLGIGGSQGINFFGQSFTEVYVNNNGNITFNSGMSQYTPNGLATGVGRPIIAPYFADVDTRNSASGLVSYGNTVIDGQEAFVVNWPMVGYFAEHADKLNDFQLILFDRSDTGAGNFDIQFNYGQIQWETGDASGGQNGLGGVPAVAGYSNGVSGADLVYSQLLGSLQSGAFLDGGADSLAEHSLNSSVAGRYNFKVRNGSVLPTPEPTTLALLGGGALGLLGCMRRKLSR